MTQLDDRLTTLLGRRLSLPGHFEGVIVVEAARSLGSGVEVRVRLATGELDEAVLSDEDVGRLLDHQPEPVTTVRPIDAERLRLLIESARIRLAYTYDRQFAVSLSSIRTLERLQQLAWISTDKGLPNVSRRSPRRAEARLG